MVQRSGEMSCGQMVAIVDDEPEIVRVLGMLLSMRGLSVSAHGSAESLLEALSLDQGRWMIRGSDGTPHVLAAAVIDFNLPGLNGAELVLRLRAMAEGFRVVMITAAREQLQPIYGTALQDVTVLSKPFSIESLEAALR